MPLSIKERDRLCCETINEYLFDHVWNEPVSEFRTNIKPYLVHKGSCVGSVSALDGTILLPTAGESYYIWAISAEHFNIGLKLQTQKWYSTEEIVNEWKTLIHMYGPAGQLFHKGCVFFYYNACRQTIFIAVKKLMFQKVMNYNQIDQVYLTVYYDSDMPNYISALSFDLSKGYKEIELHQKLTEFTSRCRNPEQLQYFRNGYEITVTTAFPNVEKGDYLDVILDENIAFTFDIDCYVDNENPVFLSEREQTWKQLLHIPKELNPDNKVITHNTCDFFIQRIDDPEHHGYYVHRAAGKRSVSQVTHNDMAMPLFIVDAYRDALATEDVTIHGVVRIHDKDNHLIREASYIDLLYTHDDEQIIQILMGRYKPAKDLTFWTAPELEKSKYVEMLFDTPNLATPDNMQEYIDGIGYYPVVNLLCRRIVDTVITDAFHGSYTFKIPVIYNGHVVTPLVYLNKRIINMNKISSSCDLENGTCTVTIDPSVKTKIGDELVVIFYVDGKKDIYSFTPDVNTLTIEVNYTNPVVYLTTFNSKKMSGINTDSNYSYRELTTGTNEIVVRSFDDGTSKITVNPDFIGEELLIFNRYCTHRTTMDIRSYTSNGSNIAIRASGLTNKTYKEVPIIHFQNVAVYLNGEYLVRGIDYFVNTVKDSNGNVSFHEVVVQTMDHFNEGGNDILDILYNVAEIEDISSGFVIDNQLKDESPVNLYFDNISTAHVKGLLERHGDFKGVYMDLPVGSYRQGDIWEIQTAIPRIVSDFVNQYSANNDHARIVQLNEYFHDLVQVVPDVLVMERKHRIYSTFMTKFFTDLVRGDLVLLDEPDVIRMKEQIKPYLYLRDMDLCFSKIDKRFVDFYPQYVNYETPPHLKRMLDKYVQLFLPENYSPTVEVYDDGNDARNN